MATSSRKATLFGVNDWQTIYKTFSSASFLNYDYETLRKSFIDYLQKYYPETFNDFIESSEFVALLDVIAYMGQSMAFRNDLNTRENFIDTAERRDSVIKLANLVSYTPKRNLAGQGYLKVTSIKTSQNITDINGLSLSNTVVIWNDPTNSAWQEQFNTILNSALVSSQRVGHPANTSTVLGNITSEYNISIPTTDMPVYPFSVSVDGTQMMFELVSSTSVGKPYIYEKAPGPTNEFNILYRNDKLGFGSPNTGFFFYFKQGQLKTYNFTVDQQIANRVTPIDTVGVNDSDTWLYQTINNNSVQWQMIDNLYSDAYKQSLATASRKLFSVASGYNDQVSYLFGSGVLSEMPVGNFTAYVRSSNGLTYTIDPIEMQGITLVIPYISRLGRTESLTVNLELMLPVTNAQGRESLENIKQRAPTKFYTQNRMVNGEDYNNFPYSLYSSIIKSKALNRTSIGVARNLDLLDPSGKYSSVNTFAKDGALYLKNTLGETSLTITDTSNIVNFLTTKLSMILSDNKTLHYYTQLFDRYVVTDVDQPKIAYWKTQTVDAGKLTGYFYNLNYADLVPIPVGSYSINNVKYLTKHAMLKFTAPSGSYFSADRRIVSGIPGPSDCTYLWVSVLNVLGDGYNNGVGAFSDGTGPITLSGYVPTGAILDSIIPSFGNTLPPAVLQECIVRMGLMQSFSLRFDNSLNISQDRWSIVYPAIANPATATWPKDILVNFTADPANNSYSVMYRKMSYCFGSVSETKFLFSNGKLVYDPLSGQVLNDTISIMSVNKQPDSNNALVSDINLSIIDQPMQPSGYVNQYEVDVASIAANNKTIIVEPDFFEQVTGYTFGAKNKGIYVFFNLVSDYENQNREQLIKTSDVVYVWATKSDVELVKYEYPVNQLFYAYSENKFYSSVQDNTTQVRSYVLKDEPTYFVRPGRQGLTFQYKHNSNNTTRVDPGIANIIDLFVVTQSYYNEYKNWLQDTTNIVSEPIKPTINELSSAYDRLQDYKMLSDSVVLNSVVFKPLFGPKADPELRATIKAVRSQSTNASDSEIRSAILSAINTYFDISNWNFGDTFYFSELSAYIHTMIGEMVSSIVLVPDNPAKSFGSLYEIKAAPYEIFVNAATASDILIIDSLTSAELQIR